MIKLGDLIVGIRSVFVNVVIIEEFEVYFFGLFVVEGILNLFFIIIGFEEFKDFIVFFIEDYDGYILMVEVRCGFYRIFFRKKIVEWFGEFVMLNVLMKVVFERVLNVGEFVVVVFLVGYLDGDGYLIELIVELVIKSCEFVDGFVFLFKRFGIILRIF